MVRARDGALHPLQDAFAELGAAQCGYCTPGFLLAARALLDSNPAPTRDEIKESLSGNKIPRVALPACRVGEVLAAARADLDLRADELPGDRLQQRRARRLGQVLEAGHELQRLRVADRELLFQPHGAVHGGRECLVGGGEVDGHVR